MQVKIKSSLLLLLLLLLLTFSMVYNIYECCNRKYATRVKCSRNFTRDQHGQAVVCQYLQCWGHWWRHFLLSRLAVLNKQSVCLCNKKKIARCSKDIIFFLVHFTHSQLDAVVVCNIVFSPLGNKILVFVPQRVISSIYMSGFMKTVLKN